MNSLRAGSSNAVKVLTVDDHEPFLEVAHEMIHSTSGFEPVAEVSSGASALAAAREIDLDLVLVDVHMPGMSGVETSRQLTARHPGVVVVLISTADPSDLPAATRSCGAVEMLRKQDLGPAAIRRVWAAHKPSSAT